MGKEERLSAAQFPKTARWRASMDVRMVDMVEAV